jgi:hypothetical protein
MSFKQWMFRLFIGPIDPWGTKIPKPERAIYPRTLVQSSGYDQNIKRVFGKMRLGGNVIWSAPVKRVLVQQGSSGGKGFGGGSSQITPDVYNFFGTFAVALAVGPISSVLKIWINTTIIYNIDTTDVPSLDASARVPVIFYLGTETQNPDPTIEGYEGAGNVSANRGIAYVVFNDYNFGETFDKSSSFTFEVQS